MRGQCLLKKIAVSAMALTVAFAMMPSVSAHAASEYTVTFRPGNVGQFGIASEANSEASAKDMAQEVADILYGAYDASVTENGAIKIKVPAGASIPAAPAYIIPDEGYFVKTWGPESGTTVNKNADYVVDYGRLTDGVEYTVKYVDEQSGESIAPFATAYANVGESVQINAPATITTSDAGTYVLTSTATQQIVLDKDASANVIVFNYTYSYDPGTVTEDNIIVIPGGTVTTTEIVTIPAANEGNVEPGAVQVQGGVNDNDADADNEDNQNPDVVDIEDEETPLADTTPTEEAGETDIPPEIIDIEEEEAPLAILQPDNGINFAVVLAGILGVVVVAVTALWIQMKKKQFYNGDEE